MIKEKYCSKCKRTNVKLLKYSKPKNVQYYRCRECNNTKQKDYFQTERGHLVISNVQRRAYARNSAKIIARTRVNQAAKAGALVKPHHCELCGLSGRIEGHHPKYSRQLEVLWLCVGCHADIHKVV